VSETCEMRGVAVMGLKIAGAPGGRQRDSGTPSLA
jgi:hypothetical protein